MTSVDVSGEAVPVLVGTSGWVDGELYVLKNGESVVIGRSRSCDISLRRIVAYLERSPGERDADHDFNTVSRRHMRITVATANAKFEDLSTNGSFFNGEALSEAKEADLSDAAVEIRLGTRETFRLEMADPERLEALRNSSALANGAVAEGDSDAGNSGDADNSAS
ncbi:MAG: FHA domain-containing protein [Planctomycetota bacterium]|jgi:pSer/pThr/pTyr-binding forkhead associated (FHA) protein|nr:FHA domain-containing protein [Planctomycetota bacterium]